jgi:hypothetical protein
MTTGGGAAGGEGGAMAAAGMAWVGGKYTAAFPACVGGSTWGEAEVGGIVGATDAAPHRGHAAPGEGAVNASAQRGQWTNIAATLSQRGARRTSIVRPAPLAP